MHIGIIFQGPMKSRSFDCAPLLLDYHGEISSLKEVRISCCLSTWPDEIIPENLKNLGWLILTNEPVSGFDLYNRQKQIVTTLNGAVRLTSLRQPDFLLKIRTDLKFDLKSLIEHIMALEKSGALGDRMLFPAANRRLPFWLSDLFFGGRPETMIDFLKAGREFKDVCMRYCPEMDFPLKFFLLRRRDELPGLTDAEWFLNIFAYPYVAGDRIMETQSRLWWDKLLDRYFVLSPKCILEKSVWRGLPLTGQYGIHGADFFETRRQASPGDFGIQLKPLQPMPWWSRIIQWGKGRLEFFRWRRSLPMTGACFFAYKAFDKADRVLNKMLPPPC